MQCKASRLEHRVVVSVVCCRVHAVFLEFGAQQILQMLCVSVVAGAYAWKDGYMKERLTFLSLYPTVAVSTVTRRRFLQLICELNRRKIDRTIANMTMSAIFEVVMFIHCLSVFYNRLQTKPLTQWTQTEEREKQRDKYSALYDNHTFLKRSERFILRRTVLYCYM